MTIKPLKNIQENINIVLKLEPEQYHQLMREAEKVGSLSRVTEQAIQLYQELQNKTVKLNGKLKTVYDSLNIADVEELLGDDDQAWYIRGVLLSSLKKYEEAISSFDVALKINPNHQKAWHKKGIAYYLLDFYERATDSFERALEIDPDNYLCWYSLGKSWLELETFDQAIESFNRALNISPDFELAKEARQSLLDSQKLTRVEKQMPLKSVAIQSTLSGVSVSTESSKPNSSGSLRKSTNAAQREPVYKLAAVAVASRNYSIDVIKDEVRSLVEQGVISRQQPIYVLVQYIPPREWVKVECELERCDYLLRDSIGDLISSDTWDND